MAEEACAHRNHLQLARPVRGIPRTGADSAFSDGVTGCRSGVRDASRPFSRPSITTNVLGI
jgi:hypothetical protein